MNDALAAPIQALFDEVARQTSDGRDPDLAAIGSALAALAADRQVLEPWIDRLAGRSGAIPIRDPERGPRLTLVHRLTGQMSAVHDHGTWVAISPVRGTETHRRWRRRSATAGVPGIELADDVALGRAEVATLLPPDDVHDHGHLLGRGDPAYVLILLGDAQIRYRRNEWDLATGRHRILEPGDGGRWISTEPFPDEPVSGRAR